MTVVLVRQFAFDDGAPRVQIKFEHAAGTTSTFFSPDLIFEDQHIFAFLPSTTSSPYLIGSRTPFPPSSSSSSPLPFLDAAAAVIGQGRGGTVSPARSYGGGGGVRVGCAGVGGPGGLEAAGRALRKLAGVRACTHHAPPCCRERALWRDSFLVLLKTRGGACVWCLRVRRFLPGGQGVCRVHREE